MYDFEYHRPKGVEEAAALLADKGDAKLLAGGMSLLPTLKLRLARHSDIVDLSALARGRDARLGVARLGRRRGRRGEPEPKLARRRSWLQVSLGHDVSCALGVSLGCVVIGTDGPLRVCREGPVFAFGEVAWERR